VSILYRTHKSLHPVCKVNGLYAFDALARAARSHATKHGQTADVKDGKGNCATFLQKMEGFLHGLFKDMLTIEGEEPKVSFKLCSVLFPCCRFHSETVIQHATLQLDLFLQNPSLHRKLT
jgi:hypothetical protein